MRVLVLTGMLTATFLGAAPARPTFYKDVLPVLQNKCQGCHRPGEAAPMSFLTYEGTRPYAAAIRQAVLSKKMPPWGADGVHGKFSNDPTLSEAEKSTLADWAEAKAPAGNPKEAPAPRKFVEGWNIGQPDLVVAMPKPYSVPDTGTIEYTRFIMPLNFTEDRWVSAAEVRPGNRAVVHHVIAYLREPGSNWLKGAPIGEPIVKVAKSDAGPRGSLAGYAPGVPALPGTPGQALRVKAGTDLVLEMHYTTNGKAATDLTKVGIIFAKEPPAEVKGGFGAANSKFVIPPGAASHEVKSEWKVTKETTLVNLTPHMHLRGKAFRYEATYPTGEKEVLLNVPRYDFNWQHTYVLAQPKLLPAGTVIECTALFDNSPNNKFNPDPKAEVRWGDQSWEEMMIGFGTVVTPR
jgi:hypothetical protein